MNENYDIIIVGAGLAGLSTAIALSNSKLNILLLDNNKNFDHAHMIGIYNHVIKKFGIRKAVKSKINILSIVTPSIENRFDFTHSKYFLNYTDLKEAYKLLSKKVKCKFKRDIEIINAEQTSKGILLTDKNLKRFFAKIVIDCSGNSAVVASSLGIKKSRIYNETLSGTVKFKPTKKRFIQYQDRTVTRNAGAWIVPISKTKAHVGISSYVPYFSPSKPDLERRLELFLNNMNKRFNLGINLRYLKNLVYKQSPVIQPINPMSKDNLLVVGDAAGQATSFYGMGSEIALTMGEIAGKLSEKAIKNNNFSANFLKTYERKWWDLFGKYDGWNTFLRHYIITYFKDEDWDRINSNLKKYNAQDYYSFLKSKYSLKLLLKLCSWKLFFSVLGSILKESRIAFSKRKRISTKV